jgi:hypothetical protein
MVVLPIKKLNWHEKIEIRPLFYLKINTNFYGT